MNKYLIDIGSSTVKFYKQENKKIMLMEQKTIGFKEGFTEYGLSACKKAELIDYFNYLSKKYFLTNRNTKLYATGIFRDIINKKLFVEDFFARTGLYFNIISHDLEAFYLERAWIHKSCKNIGRMIVINIGGKTTEILLYENGTMIDEPKKLTIGVGTVLKKYPGINDTYSEYSVDSVVKDILEDMKSQLPPSNIDYNIAIYTGGELSYMKCADYNLISNTIIEDSVHPYMIHTSDYFQRNKAIFSEISMTELKNMMPQNPEWMGGARACSALAQAILQYYKVKTVIPSDSNLIDGVHVQEANHVVICGSFNKHLRQIDHLIRKLNRNDISVLSPRSTEVIGSENDFVLFKNDIIVNHNTWAVEELHLKAIDKCDFVIACNYDNYIGVSTTFELEHAYRAGKKIVFVEDNEIADTFGKRIGAYPMPCEIGIL
ncbi:hypothetical protein [Diplocloster hominis]|uniref:Ppx/GppA phosphatase family protein n=1 Tax=Diplocloster hominis TaxID=3079010 RepID=UPI0031BB61E8